MRRQILTQADDDDKSVAIQITRDEALKVVIADHDDAAFILTIAKTPEAAPMIEMHGTGAGIDITPAAVRDLIEGDIYQYNIWELQADGYVRWFYGALAVGKSIAPTGAETPAPDGDDFVAIVASRAEFEGLQDGLATEEAASKVASNLGDIIFLSDIVAVQGAAGQAVTGSIPPAQSHISVAGGQRLWVQWPVTNTAAGPTLKIGATTFRIDSVNGGQLKAGDLVAGRRYQMVIQATDPARIRLLAPVDASDINGLVGTLNNINLSISTQDAAWKAASNLGDYIFVSNVSEESGSNGQIALGSIATGQAHIPLAGGQRLWVQWPKTNTAANPSLKIGGDVFQIDDANGLPLKAGDLVTSRRYEMVVQSMSFKRIRLLAPVGIAGINGLSGALDQIRSDAASDTLAWQNTSNLGDSLYLTSIQAVVGSNGQAVTASRPYAQAHIPVAGGQLLWCQWPVTNTGPFPTLKIDGTEYRIDDVNGNALKAGDLIASRRYQMVIQNVQYGRIRLMSPVGLSDINGLPEEIDQLRNDLNSLSSTEDAQSNITDLADSLSDKLRSTHITLVGDSITWGRTASDNGVWEPHNHTLDDPRDVITSGSWANKLRRWASWIACGGRGLAEPAPGESAYSHVTETPVFTDPAFTVLSNDGVTLDKTGETGREEPLLKSYLTLPAGNRCAFDITGSEFTVYYCGVADSAFTIEVDGVEVAEFTSGNFTGWKQALQVSGLAFGVHQVEIVSSGAASARIEAVRFAKTLRVTNSGLIGTNSAEWTPGRGLIEAGVPETSTHVLIQLGTNDRAKLDYGDLPVGEVRTSINLRKIVDWLRKERPAARITLMAPPMAIEDEQTNGAKFFAGTDDLMREVQQVSEELGVAFVDNYSPTIQDYVGGVQFLVIDNLHPNDHGHDVIFRNIVNAIQRAM